MLKGHKVVRNMRILVVLIVLFPFVADAECVRPDMETTLTMLTGNDYFPGLEGTFLEVSIEEASHYQWLQMSWDGPPSGMLAALTCDGEVLGGVEIGKIEKLLPVTISHFNVPVMRAEYLAGIGTSGYRHTKIGLFGILNRQVVELWSHDLYFRDFQLCKESNEIQYMIDLSPDNTHITVTGVRKTTTGTQEGVECTLTSEASEVLPIETSCWDHNGAFKKCTQQ